MPKRDAGMDTPRLAGCQYASNGQAHDIKYCGTRLRRHLYRGFGVKKPDKGGFFTHETKNSGQFADLGLLVVLHTDTLNQVKLRF